MNSDSKMLACLFFLTLIAYGCGSSEPPRLKTFPVSGKVLVNGQPANHAEVTFHSKSPLKNAEGRDVFPFAITQADGTFDVLTYSEADGAPPGQYDVTITWPLVKQEGGEDIYGPDRLKGKFGYPSSPVVSVTIEEKENILPPIELKTR